MATKQCRSGTGFYIGVVLVFFFGLPSISVLSGGSYSEIQTTLRIEGIHVRFQRLD